MKNNISKSSGAMRAQLCTKRIKTKNKIACNRLGLGTNNASRIYEKTMDVIIIVNQSAFLFLGLINKFIENHHMFLKVYMNILPKVN